MRRSLVSVVALVSAACRSASQPPAVATTTVDLGSASSAAAAKPAGPPDVADAVAVVPPTPLCSIHGPYWRGEIDLRATPDDAVLARITRAHDVDLLLTDGPAAFFHGYVGSQEINGYGERTGIMPRRAMVLGEVYVPSTWVSVIGVRGDTVTVAPHSLRYVTPLIRELRADVACADLGTAPTDIDASTAWGGAKPLREASFVPDRDVDLSVVPADPPVISFFGDDLLATRKVSVIEERAGRARVHWHQWQGDFFGWVQASLLRPWVAGTREPKELREPALEEAAEFGMIGVIPAPHPDRPAPAPQVQRVVCRRPVRVLAATKDRTYVVGQIAPGAPFRVDPRPDAAVSPLEPPGWVEPGTEVKWLAASRDVGDCAPSTASEASDDDPGVSFVIGESGRSHSRPSVPDPHIREGTMKVTGRLPEEVIRRIIRQNFGRFRLCYENGQRRTPSLRGRVVVRFVVARDGSVSSSRDGGSSLADKGVVACIVAGFGNLSFPQPEAGTVQVEYSIAFAPRG